MTSSTNLPHHSVKNISNQSPFTSKPLRICVNPFCRLSALGSERFCPCTAKLPKWGSSPTCHKASVIDGHQCFWWNGLLSLTKLKDFEVHPFSVSHKLTLRLVSDIYLVVVAFQCRLCLQHLLALDAGSTSAASCFRSADGGNSLQQAGNPSPNPGSQASHISSKGLGRWIPLTYRNSSSLRTCQKHQIHRNSIKFLENSKFVTKPIGISMLPQYHSSFLAHGS